MRARWRPPIEVDQPLFVPHERQDSSRPRGGDGRHDSDGWRSGRARARHFRAAEGTLLPRRHRGVGALLLPGHVEHIAGFAGFRAAVDRFIGQRNAVVAGAALMSAGHLAMAFDQSFLVALALLILGSGLLKGNISADVGAFYGVDDEANRVRAYTVFSMAINIGAVLGPIVCVLLAYSIGLAYGASAPPPCSSCIGLVTYMILVLAILVLGDDALSPIWPFLYFAMMGFSFLFY